MKITSSSPHVPISLCRQPHSYRQQMYCTSKLANTAHPPASSRPCSPHAPRRTFARHPSNITMVLNPATRCRGSKGFYASNIKAVLIVKA
jgi:hypothetical protein